MSLFSFIHASDIHLDTPFMNISPHISDECAAALRSSPFKALDSILVHAIERTVDFVLLSGDIYNGEDKSITGQIKLQEFAKKLHTEGIQLFIIAGNHDPLLTTKYQLEYPPNTFIFPTEYQVVTFEKFGKTVAYIHGVSHASKDETRPLVQSFTSDWDTEVFHIAMLHCTVGSLPQERGKKEYLPCTLAELQRKGMHYWALGHIHTKNILSEYPHVVYCGNTQAIKSSEEGLRGVYYVEVEHNKSVSMHFLPTSAVVFDTIAVALEEEDTLEILFTKIERALEEYSASVQQNVGYYIFSLIVQGATELDKTLRENPVEEWLNAFSLRIRAPFSFCIQRMVLETRNPIPIDILRGRNDLLGETIRIVEQLKKDVDLQKEVACRVQEQVNKYFKLDAKNLDIPIERVLDAVQKQCIYFFEEGK